MQLQPGLPEEVGMSTARVSLVNELAESMVVDHITSAEVIVAARRGVIVTHQAYGHLTPNPVSPVLDELALFPLCSITKVFTATCIMMLVEQGVIGLNRPVMDYIPEFKGKGKEDIRIYHLLTHTSGIRDEDLSTYIDQNHSSISIPPRDENQDEYIHTRLNLGYEVPLWRKPGEVMSYWGYGYELLGEIIRRVSGISYPQFVQKYIFEPLGMKDSFFNVPHAERYRIVKRSPNDPCAEWIETESSINSVSAAGGIYSTAMDLCIFAQMFLNKGIYNGQRVLSPISVIEMTKNHIPGVASEYRDETFPEAYWGYGWGINGTKKDGGDLFSPQAYSHWGAAGVFVAVDPVYDIAIIHFTVERDLQKPFKNMYTDYINNAVLAAIEEL
ncbi:serine hydrolase domain-containing protein [Paenibacillus crassostreae]|uniref:Beta-lactamase-related domain-containing protein n=1 Tax=Paenibacillus crassostreae TaxID=1763538 RepID=A0A167B8X3_9BACL|nr:serine hydrolase domain-containing protein [Paenibacillus crassostreae]AOZ93069.1 hypothetical protein LPB68_13175 [Paenibacillus crassostreae]OAB71842.1 hypothetical protein PNBC_17715 [Paenibacillus crassostreae]